MFRLIQFALLLVSAVAFTAPVIPRQPIMTSFTARHVLMSDAEQELVLKHANECIESECALDEVSELLSVLKGTERELEQRLEKIMNTVSHLQGINAKQQRKTDEVRAFVKDLLRVFAHEKNQFASGFSGDYTKGTLTAYDALPPKKWSPKN